MRLLSIIIPSYNEAKTILEVIHRVKAVKLKGLRKQLIIVNDGSTDSTKKKLATIKGNSTIIVNLKANHGKGYAVRLALKKAAGDVIIVQDADLEYDPEDYTDLLRPIEEGRADVVYGSRFVIGKPHRTLYFWHYAANRCVTMLSNILTNLNLTDIETGFKVFTKNVAQKLKLNEDRFGFEPEFTAKISRIRGIKIYEVGVGYYGRTYEEGKKITWKDGLYTLWCIIKYNLFRL